MAASTTAAAAPTPPAAPNTEKVRVIMPGTVFKSQVYKKGDVVEVPSQLADEWAAEGRAEVCTIKVIALRDGATVGNRVLNVGETGECHEYRALQLYGAGLVDIPDRNQLRNPRALAAPKPAPLAPLPVPMGPTVRGVARRDVCYLGRTYVEGDSIDIPEDLIERFVESGSVAASIPARLASAGSALIAAALGR